jgi:hypothetical protein
VDIGIALVTSFITACLEEIPKHYSPVAKVRWIVSLSLGFVEGCLIAVTCDDWIYRIASVAFHTLSHLVLGLIPLPVSIALHTLYNFYLKISSTKSAKLSKFIAMVLAEDKSIELKEYTDAAVEFEEMFDPFSEDTTDCKIETKIGAEVSLFGQKFVHEAELLSRTPIVTKIDFIESDLKGAFRRPSQGLFSAKGVVERRLAALPLKGDKELIRDTFHDFARRIRWQFNAYTPEQVIEYILDRPWNNSWKVMRLTQYFGSLSGDYSKQKWFVKVDEILRARLGQIGGKFFIWLKSRPIFPITDQGLLDLAWTVPLKKAMEEEVLVVDCILGTLENHLKFRIIFKYMARPNANVNTEITSEWINGDLYIMVHGDDFSAVALAISKSMELDLISCDLNCDDPYQSAFSDGVFVWSGHDEDVRSRLEARFQNLDAPQEYQSSEMYEQDIKLVRKPTTKSTLTGEGGTAVLASTGWGGITVRASKLLEKFYGGRKAPTVTEAVIQFKKLLLVSAKELGFSTEDSSPGRLLEIEETGFLGGSWVPSANHVVHPYTWAPLSAAKAMTMPAHVFSGTITQERRQWAYICSQSEISVLPIREFFAAVGSHPSVDRKATSKLWLSYQRRKRDYKFEFEEAPKYLIDYDQWELQLNSVMRKYGLEDQVSVSHMILAFQEHTETPDDFEVWSTSLLPLFAARFGKFPEATETNFS